MTPFRCLACAAVAALVAGCAYGCARIAYDDGGETTGDVCALVAVIFGVTAVLLLLLAAGAAYA